MATSKAAIRDALELAHGTLTIIESGATFSRAEWDIRMARIERALDKDSARARAVPLSATEAEAGVTLPKRCVG